MEIRESIQAFITDRNKAEGAWRPLIGTLLVSAMFAVWGLRPFSSLFQVGPNETLLCGLALFISILGVIFACFFLRPFIDVTDVDGSQIVPDACLHWIANDESVSLQAKLNVADALAAKKSLTFEDLFTYDDELSSRAVRLKAEEGDGYRALMTLRAASKAKQS
ncbi:hypothetical protein KDW82_32635 [Burkholderia vietnamiensis]|uniref:hypothetical protein n=1 Tax=Burkholderia vietnamiensis TaxID=60552 RepID=UPI001B9F8746|nr:hypothetical protein [Burkholderia vietnamiensis]MBR8193768.1 hypothetical protein [Burkholderia vietnamiensis]